MARKSSPTIEQEELYPSAVEGLERETLDDARLVDLDVEKESPFLRGQKRVSARRGPLPKKTLSGLKFAAIAAAVLFVAGMASAAVYRYSKHSWRFRIESSDDIEISGNHNVTHGQVMEVLGGDIGRNVFFIPLAERKAQLEKIPWVESASVMRFVPNRLKVEIHERTPAAFARIGSRISLIDGSGTVMELPGGKNRYSFPVIVGMNPGEPLSTRGARMKIYNELVRQLDAEGGHYSQDLSEVDVSDADDVKVLANDPNGAVLVHLGGNEFLSRYRTYVTHVQAWRQQFDKLESVDLRYDNQIIVNPDNPSAPKMPKLTPAAEKAAIAAGVKQAAIVDAVGRRPSAAPVKTVAGKPVAPKNSAKTAAPVTKAAAKHGASPHGKATTKSSSKKPATSTKTAAAKSAPGKTGPAQAATGKPAPSSTPASTGSVPASSKQKPSAAIAKNQDHVSSTAQAAQDHP